MIICDKIFTLNANNKHFTPMQANIFRCAAMMVCESLSFEIDNLLSDVDLRLGK